MTAVESQLFETARKSEIGSRNEGQNMTTWLFAKGAKVVFLDNQEGFEKSSFRLWKKVIFVKLHEQSFYVSSPIFLSSVLYYSGNTI